MADEWKVVPARDFCSSVRDGTHDSPKPVEVGRRLVTSRHITGRRLDLSSAYLISQDDFDEINRRSKVDRWDVLISMIGTVGEPCLISEEPDFSIKNIGLFKSRGQDEGKYLYYYLQSPQAQQHIREQSRGTTQAYIPLGVLREFPIRVPVRRELMQAIACILGALDDKIELNRRRNRTLEALARAIFQSWFVDFDPVKAKAADFIREGVLEIGDGYRAKIAELAAEGLPFVRAGDLHAGFTLDSVDHLGYPSVAKAGTKLSRPDDVAFTSKGTVGRIARVDESTPQFVYSPQICYWRSLDHNALHPSLLYCWMTSEDFLQQVRAMSGQTDMAPYISLRDQREILVPRFPESQKAIGEKVRHFLSRQALASIECQTLASLRDTLLPKLVSGELRVPDAERIVGRMV